MASSSSDAVTAGSSFASTELAATADHPAVNPDSNPVRYFNKRQDQVQEELAAAGIDASRYKLRPRLWGDQLHGIVHLEGHFPNLTSSATRARALPEPVSEEDKACLQHLCSTRDLLLQEAGGCLYCGMGSEGDFQVLPVMVEMPEGAGETLEPPTAMRALGLDPQLASTFQPPKSFDTSDEFVRYMQVEHLKVNENPDDEDAVTMLNAVEALFGDEAGVTKGPYLQLVAGSDELFNPVPVFWLAATKNGKAIVGLMSAIIWT